MQKNNVYSNAKVLKTDDKVEDYQLGVFQTNGELNQNQQMEQVAKLQPEPQVLSEAVVEPLLVEVRNLTQSMALMQQQITNLETTGVQSKDIDRQVVEAIKDLKHYASFFEQAALQMETKVLKTSISIAQKIIQIEVSANSASIAKETINNILSKIKTASKIMIHLNPKDYQILKTDLNLEPFIQLSEDPNVTAGGVVIASDLGNFDGNVEAKVASMLESLDTII